MHISLFRTYYSSGTNGRLLLDDQSLCYTIELPWKLNQPSISCIPEASYAVTKRYSKKFGHHLQIINVPNRSAILFHPANNALKELKGCIAPVSLLTAPGKGNNSRSAFTKLMNRVNQLPASEPIRLTICTDPF